MNSDRSTPGSQTSLREANRLRIVDAIRRYGGLTQVELAEATGLSTATVSTIVKELTGAGVVDTRPASRSGRRAQMVTLARRLGVVAAVQFGRRRLTVALGDPNREILAEQHMPLPVDHRLDTGLDRAALLVVELLERVGASMDELLTVGVALPAPVDEDTGMISVRGVLRGWDDVHVGQVLAKRLARPVLVDNDANLAALAEHQLGATRGYRDSIFVRASYGTGAGIVLGGRLHRGYAGTAGEIGHVQVDPSGPICRCGNRGCLETVVGSDALLALVRTSHGELTLNDLVQEALDGDPGCRRVVADAGDRIGAVVAALATALNPRAVVVGGELAATGDVLLDPLRESMRRHLVPNTIAPVEVLASDLGARAEILGALALALAATDLANDGLAVAPSPSTEGDPS
ncbi:MULTISPECIES: ROK family transcriptional regulator [Cellulosimicrobium]|uniref:ROK family transcriptional regulator n=1 Tax=Cellulosimicrobium TaxID=157920 RepID=UPI000A3287A4|nr:MULTISPECIES: ROK family transcriptional regulator [Cellulosimicrobium]QUB98222.1 ROK family transcriptional regulator [Cellulosimicrobium cellulans]